MKKNKLFAVLFFIFFLGCTYNGNRLDESKYLDSIALDSLRFKFEEIQKAKLDSYSIIFKTIDTLETIKKDPQQIDSEMISKVKKDLEKIEYQKKQLDTLLKTRKKR